MEVRTLPQFFLDPAWRKSLVRNDDSVLDVIISDERRVGRRINAVSGEHLCADRLHALDVVRIKHGHFFAALDASLVGELRQVVDRAGVLLQSPVNRYVVFGGSRCYALVVERLAFLAVLPDFLEKPRYGIWGQRSAGIKLADKGLLVVRGHPCVRRRWPDDTKRRNRHDGVGILRPEYRQQIFQQILRDRSDEGR